MTVYIEYAIADNLLVDYFLLKAAFYLSRVRTRRLRLFAAATVGTAFAVLLPLLQINGALLFILKVMVGELMVLVAGRFIGVKAFIRGTAVFFALTFAAGGALIGVWYLATGRMPDPLAATPFQEVSLGLCLLLTYAVIKITVSVFGGVRRLGERVPFERKVFIEDGGSHVELDAFVDSGNSLSDNFTGKPVSVIDKAVAGRLIKQGAIKLRAAHYIPASTIHGEGRILVFEIDRMLIYCGQERNIIDNAILGISPAPALRGTDVILNAGLW